IYMTEIDADATCADTFFPKIDPGVWAVVDEGEWHDDPKSGVRYRYICLSRR
ncbi:MAG: dihydrofolate reductase, partial [Muribaculaceae bacterium]|nr:dihydrofolate reductase [Muribaculaceae bacterium]